jgi:hypothetical protein
VPKFNLTNISGYWVKIIVDELGIAVTLPGTAIAELMVTDVAPAAAAEDTYEPVWMY